jgi:hypothetical protein
MSPHRPTAARKSGPVPFPGATPSFEAIKTRVLAKLEDRLDPGTSKRMPASLLRQSLRTFAEQITEQEARALPKPHRDRLVEEVLAELLGYGPLEELFREADVREILVAGPHAVIVRRDGGSWTPTSVRFRDEDHLRTAIDRLATHADPVGGVTTSVNLYDLKLPNGFRAVAVIPPPALGVSASVAFVRVEANPAALPLPQSPTVPLMPGLPSGSASAATAQQPLADPAPVSGTRPTSGESDPLARHRNRLIERLITRLTNLGVYDLRRLEITELRRIVAAYVAEYVVKERILLSDADQARLQLEILAAMHR